MEQLSKKIKEYVDNEIAKNIKKYPVNNNWSSQIGHPCIRYLVLRRLHWEQEEPVNLELQSIFDEGKDSHEQFSRWMKNRGVRIIMEETPFPDRGYQISGKIDGFCQFQFMDKPKVYEYKSMSSFAWAKIDTWDDVISSKSLYTRNYAVQFNTYLYLAEQEDGLFFIKNKEKGMSSLKVFLVPLNYELAENTLKKCESINKHLTDKTLPPFHNDISICAQCSMRYICQPPLERTETEIMTDTDIINKFDRMMEIKPIAEEYNDLQKELKKPFEGKNLMISNYLIQGHWVDVKGRTQEVKPYKYWKQEIVKIDTKA